MEQPRVPDQPNDKNPEVKMVNSEKKSDAPTSTHGSKTDVVAEEEQEYITGIKLYLVVSAVTLVAFLMLLDMSIIATVSLAEIC
jgi:hypothetical protein